MKVLVDTNVLLDVALNRTPHVGASGALLDALEAGIGRGFVTSHAIATFYYLLDAKTSKTGPVDMVKDLLKFLDVAVLDSAGMKRATALPLPDFEDAMQASAAQAAACDLIATRNVKDFSKSPVRANTPKQVLEALED